MANGSLERLFRSAASPPLSLQANSRSRDFPVSVEARGTRASCVRCLPDEITVQLCFRPSYGMACLIGMDEAGYDPNLTKKPGKSFSFFGHTC